MKNVRVFLADGFEEIEALTVVDILRRAGVETTTVSVTKKCVVEGAHGICVEAERIFMRQRCSFFRAECPEH